VALVLCQLRRRVVRGLEQIQQCRRALAREERRHLALPAQLSVLPIKGLNSKANLAWNLIKPAFNNKNPFIFNKTETETTRYLGRVYSEPAYEPSAPLTPLYPTSPAKPVAAKQSLTWPRSAAQCRRPLGEARGVALSASEQSAPSTQWEGSCLRAAASQCEGGTDDRPTASRLSVQWKEPHFLNSPVSPATQKSHLAAQRRPVQRRAALAVAAGGVTAHEHQQPHAARETLVAGPVQRRAPVGVLRLQQRAAPGAQVEEERRVAVLRRHVAGGVAGVVRRLGARVRVEKHLTEAERWTQWETQ
jgi:hypothetical protein